MTILKAKEEVIAVSVGKRLSQSHLAPRKSFKTTLRSTSDRSLSDSLYMSLGRVLLRSLLGSGYKDISQSSYKGKNGKGNGKLK